MSSFCWCFYYIEKHAVCLKDYRIQTFLSIWHVLGDLCKHLGIDLTTIQTILDNVFFKLDISTANYLIVYCNHLSAISIFWHLLVLYDNLLVKPPDLNSK